MDEYKELNNNNCESLVFDSIQSIKFPAFTILDAIENISIFAREQQVALASIELLKFPTLDIQSTIENIVKGYQSALTSFQYNVDIPTLALQETIENIVREQQAAFASIESIKFPELALQDTVKNISSFATAYQSALASIQFIDLYPAKPLKIPITPIFSSEIITRRQDIEEKSVIAYDEDEFEFNKKAYGFLCDLEVCLRALIQERIIIPYKSNLTSKIPEATLKDWEEKRNADSQNYENYRLIDYSDFSDLKKIFEKGRNKELFKDLFDDEQYKALISKLHELNPIRIKIAHFRPLSKREITRLTLYHYDILTVVQKSS